MTILSAVVAAVGVGDRQVERRQIRREMARAAMIDKRYAEISSEIAALEREIDQADSVHARDAEVLQQQLSEIREQQADAAAERRPVSDRLEARRRELQEKLTSANTLLETRCRELNDRLVPLRREARTIGQNIVPASVFENRLLRAGSPALVVRYESAMHGADWAAARLRDAQEKLKNAESLAAAAKRANDLEPERIYLARISKWNAAIDDSVASLREARAHCDELRQELLDE
jgi:hypothetical protein